MKGFIADRHAVAQIQRKLSSTRELRSDFSRETTVVFRLRLPPDRKVVLRKLSDYRTRAFNRDKVRIYWVDSDPFALYGKPTAYFVFSGSKIARWERVDAPVIVAGRRVADVCHDPNFEEPVGNATAYYERLAEQRTRVMALETEGPPEPLPAPPAPLPPLSYPLPPSDLPGGATATGETGTTAGSDPPANNPQGPCTPINLALGLLFQGQPTGPPADPDNLGRELREMLRTLTFRGYGAPGLPPPVVRASAANNSLNLMVAALVRMIPTQFCSCPPDQLVIVVAGHGYGANVGGNPHNAVAFKAEPHGGGAVFWVTHAQLAQALGAALAARGIAPSKVFLILYSCRSGDAHNPGRYGQFMNGSLIITATPDGMSFTHIDRFSTVIIQCLRSPSIKSWADFLTCVKSGLTAQGEPSPAGGRPAN